ncbi:MAG: hypothetical protein R6W69_11150 [Anaerolineales bacterium]
MNKKRPTPRPDRASYLKHKRETRLQILLPIILGSMLILALFALVAYATFAPGGDVERWAAISTIWIVIPLLAVLLVTLILVAGMVYGMHRLLKVTPDYTGLAQEYVLMITTKIRHYNTAFTSRLIRLRAWAEALQSVVKRN